MHPARTTTSRDLDAGAPPPPEARHRLAAEYWAENLDPQNLERGPARMTRREIMREVDFAATPDFSAAVDWLAGTRPRPEPIVDLGCGLGANAFAMARRGWRVLCVDTSVTRLRSLRWRARELGLEDRILTLAAAAESLPLRAGAVRGIYTKSVLIHTDLPVAAAELARVLATGGRAALVEPQPGNPFAALYRQTLAPRAWRGITRYFGDEEQRIFRDAIAPDAPPDVVPFYFLSFLAFLFQFGLPSRPLFRATLGLIHPFDRFMMRRFGELRRRGWFGLIRLERGLSKTPDLSSTS